LTVAARSYTSAAPAPLKSNISTTSSAVVSSTKDLIINSQRIVAGAVVSRQPLILRDLTPFEKEYFLYQKNLERDHAAAFGAEFYFKKGSVAERRWKQQEAERQAAASGASSTSTGAKGSKSSKGSAAEAVQDEVTEEDRVAALEAKIQFNDRITDADRKNDVRSLERALARTLYLIVKKPREQHAWQFPQGGVRVCENLQEVIIVHFFL
jgi:large subunit ribosomal protein L46